MLVISDECKKTYSGTSVGILIMKNVCNLPFHEALESKKQELQAFLKNEYNEYSRNDLKNISLIRTYSDYYKRFKKTYHVLLQLESVVLKKKSIPTVSTLVESMFMAELKNFLLTAGHDLQSLEFPITLNVAKGTERYIGINNQEWELNTNDQFISDQQGIISSISYGPDKRTRIHKNTRDVLYAVYALPGIDENVVLNHLKDIMTYVNLFSPKAEVKQLKVYL